jgi:hypothetical protein
MGLAFMKLHRRRVTGLVRAPFVGAVLALAWLGAESDGQAGERANGQADSITLARSFDVAGAPRWSAEAIWLE